MGGGKSIIKSIRWGEAALILAGDPTRRLIDFKGKLDKMNQDAIDVRRDTSYVLMRPGRSAANSAASCLFGQILRVKWGRRML